MNSLVALIPLLPFITFLVIGLNLKKLGKTTVSILACGSVFLAFVFSIILFIKVQTGHQPISITLFEWLPMAKSSMNFSFVVDQLSALMLLIVTGIGFLIHVYSIGYMQADEGFSRFFAYMNLFVFSMLILVLGSNFLMMFIGWEGVGLCSYLLIGFWYKNNAYNYAARKAFIMNRIGDLGFLLGMFFIYIGFRSLDFNTISAITLHVPSGKISITIGTMLLFIGAIGKSAQLPLFTWLPDAMAGPTPVSALIHAATMVTAGVYMIARANFLFILAPITMHVIATTGVLTALIAATIAIYQNDIKKILAYSTISQLGYMFLGLGTGAFTGAMFHLTTHAFFKALLFLGAGSIIHALGGEQDIRKMGGLKKHLPITYLVFLAGTVAIAGIPPFSGFFSKDEILWHAYQENKLLWGLGLLGSMMTAFYMFRVFFLTFSNSFRGTEHQKNHLHESPNTMIIPLIILAILSILGGVLNIPSIFGGTSELQKFLSPVLETSGHIVKVVSDSSLEFLLMILAVIAVLAMTVYAWIIFVKKEVVPQLEEVQHPFLAKLFSHKYYIDEFYAWLIERPVLYLSGLFHQFDKEYLDKLVDGIGQAMIRTGKETKRLQTGTIGFYLVSMVLGIIILLVLGLMI